MMSFAIARWFRTRATLTGIAVAVLVAGLAGVAAEQKFYADDPLAREPETADASNAEPWDIDLY